MVLLYARFGPALFEGLLRIKFDGSFVEKVPRPFPHPPSPAMSHAPERVSPWGFLWGLLRTVRTSPSQLVALTI